MNRNETDASKRYTGAIAPYDVNGVAASGVSFKTSTGECVIALDFATPVAAAADAAEIGTTGTFRYPPSQAETNVNVGFVVYLRQKARLSLASKTTNCTTKIRGKIAAGKQGDATNQFTLAWVQSGAVSPTTGTLTSSTSADPNSGLTLTNYVFTFKDGVTTTANFETLIAASADLEIDAAGASATLHTVDAFAATALSGGMRDASYTQIIKQPDTTAATIAAAVGNGLLVGSYTRDQIARLMLAIEAGPVTGFIAGTLIFVCPVTGKIRLTVALGPDGRNTSTFGDLD